MKKNFVQLRSYLIHRYPHMNGHVHGQNYPISAPLSLLANIVGTAQTCSIIGLFMGERIFTGLLGMNQVPDWFMWAKNNKIQVLGGLFVMNMIVQNMALTGAFEISCDGKLVYSKLETGRLPTMDDIFDGFERAGCYLD